MEKNLLHLLRGGLSQEKMAQKYDVKQQTWYSWESGRTIPSNEIMLQMEHDFFLILFNYKMKLKRGGMKRKRGITNESTDNCKHQYH